MITKKEIAIGIVDVYSQRDLDNCYNSIPEDLRSEIFCVSNTKNKFLGNINNFFRYERDISYAGMMNRLLSQFRLLGKKYYFLFHSNMAVTKDSFFEETLDIASNFGTWFMTGPGKDTIFIDDESNNISLPISSELNGKFLFIFSGIIKNNGYFNENYFTDNQLELLDYITGLRKLGVYPPRHFNPTIKDGLYESEGKLQKIPTKEPIASNISFGYFHHFHKYIPGMDDPQGYSREQMFKEIEEIQKAYGKK